MQNVYKYIFNNGRHIGEHVITRVTYISESQKFQNGNSKHESETEKRIEKKRKIKDRLAKK